MTFESLEAAPFYLGKLLNHYRPPGALLSSYKRATGAVTLPSQNIYI